MVAFVLSVRGGRYDFGEAVSLILTFLLMLWQESQQS